MTLLCPGANPQCAPTSEHLNSDRSLFLNSNFTITNVEVHCPDSTWYKTFDRRSGLASFNVGLCQTSLSFFEAALSGPIRSWARYLGT